MARAAKDNESREKMGALNIRSNSTKIGMNG